MGASSTHKGHRMHLSSHNPTWALRLLAVTGLALTTAPAQAAVASTSGLTLIAPPAAVYGNFLVKEHLPGQVVFNEQQGVTLGSALTTDTGVIAAGTRVDSQFFAVNAKPPKGVKGIVEDTSVTFDEKILGVVFKDSASAPYGTLFTASDFLGNPSTTYNETCVLCGFEKKTGDTITIVGDTVYFHSRYSNPGDFARIITAAVPEPSSWAMMIIGLGLVGTALRRVPRFAV